MSTSAEHPADSELDLLRILCCVAWADGRFTPEEQDLLERLMQRYGITGGSEGNASVAAGVFAATPEPVEALDRLVPRLSSVEDRQLAVKLAYMMIRLGSHGQGDSGIEAGEKVAYRRLVEAVALPESEVEEAEWAGEQELPSQNGLLALLRSRFAWLPV